MRKLDEIPMNHIVQIIWEWKNDEESEIYLKLSDDRYVWLERKKYCGAAWEDPEGEDTSYPGTSDNEMEIIDHGLVCDEIGRNLRG